MLERKRGRKGYVRKENEEEKLLEKERRKVMLEREKRKKSHVRKEKEEEKLC